MKQMEEAIIAVDIGTTSTKTLLIDRRGNVLASHSGSYPLYTPKPNIAEQNPDEIYEAVVRGIRQVATFAQDQQRLHQVVCVSFSSAMHSLLAVDGDLSPLTQCITFADNRSASYLHTINELTDANALYRRTGTPIHPMSPLLKLMWMRDHEPQLLKKAFKWMGIKEYIFAKFFGETVVDYSIASATGLFHLQDRTWDEEALEITGIASDQLSEPVNTTHVLRGLKADVAAELNLPPDMPFVIGASDGVLANLGIGAIDPGVYAVTIGTSGAVRGVVREPITDEQGRLFCYALHDDYWVIGGAINNGGIMLRWVKEQLAAKESSDAESQGIDPYDYLNQIADTVPPGANGLLFLPFLAGERAPYWNADARGVFFGLELSHEKKHMIRAVMEGVMYRILSVTQALEEIGGSAREIRASGGFARSNLWRQMMADVLNARVTVPASIESSSLGAAKLGFFALGMIANFAETSDWVQIAEQHVPDPDDHAVYAQLFDIYMDVYHQLKSSFQKISAFQRTAFHR